ncbi:hypothetical protein Aduo_016882 [Ancylostoma duodenale]
MISTKQLRFFACLCLSRCTNEEKGKREGPRRKETAHKSQHLQTEKQRLAAYRFVAYTAVIFSVVAVLSICITLPMVYNYIHHVKRSMKTEIHYCRGSAENI